MGKQKENIKGKEPVKMRFKKLSNGKQSIYLDCYADGKRQYEYLNLYLLPEDSASNIKKNKATMKEANATLKLRINSFMEDKSVKQNKTHNIDITLGEWMQKFYEIQKRNGIHDLLTISNATKVIHSFDDSILLKKVDKDYCLRFIDYLRNDYKSSHGKKLVPKTCSTYLGQLRTALNTAVRENIIPKNPYMLIDQIDKIKVPESKREYLTIDEVKKIMETPCYRDDLKHAYLFSCFCGLRISDIENLKWSDINLDGEQWRVTVTMQKTSTPIYLPLSKQAMKWLPERGETSGNELVFGDLPNRGRIGVHLAKWAKDAGITKSMSYHTSRHTFATMMLTLGADLYTVSKLLGHHGVRQTQIYAKIIDQKKDDAIHLADRAF